MNTVVTARRIPFVLAVTAALALAAGCAREKSYTPLSPSVAGPQAGVTLTAPVPVQPGANQQIKDADQPIGLLVENAQSNSPRPFTMTVQIAADAAFATVLFTQTGIPPASEGRTLLRLPSRLQPGRAYFWRTRADDGANSSGWSDPVPFQVLQPIVIGRPEPLAPIGNAVTSSMAPQLRVRNGQVSGPVGQIGYFFQLSQSQAFAGLVTEGWADPGSGETTFNLPVLAAQTTFYWRSRISDGTNSGEWSRTESFRTPAPAPAPSPSPTPGNGGSCASSNGPTIINCIAAKYPDRLAAGVSSSQRLSNMEFLRDRIIEAGICGGLDLAWNKKRGTGPHSIDAIAWRTSGGDEVVDVGAAYDDTSRPLRLIWQIVGGPPGYDPYPKPNCQ
jgi:hypothetical protein